MPRATFVSLFESSTASFGSSLGLEESVVRLRAATKPSAWSALGTDAAVGMVSAERVALWRLRWASHNTLGPHFIGHFASSGRGTVLHGRFSTPWTGRLFLLLWFGFGSLLTLVLAFAALARQGAWYIPLPGIGMILFGLALAKHCARLAREDMDWLSKVISEALAPPPTSRTQA